MNNQEQQQFKELVKLGMKELVDAVPVDRMITREEVLNRFYNIHLNQLVTAEINLGVFSKKDPGEIVGFALTQVAQGVAPMKKDVTAKKEVEKWQKIIIENQEILAIIEELRKQK